VVFLGLVSEEAGISVPTEIKRKTLEIVHKLLEADLIQASFSTLDRTFERWMLSPNDVIGRVKYEWDSLDRESTIEDVALFTTTKKGDAITKKLKAQIDDRYPTTRQGQD
jgi:hypothetical protein